MVQAAGAEGTEFDLIFSNAYLRTISQASNGLFGEFFEAIGITMNPVDLDYAGFNATYYGRTFKDERDALFGFTTTTPSATGYFYDNVHSQSAKAYHAVNDPQIDEWAEQQRSEVDPEERKASPPEDLGPHPGPGVTASSTRATSRPRSSNPGCATTGSTGRISGCTRTTSSGSASATPGSTSSRGVRPAPALRHRALAEGR